MKKNIQQERDALIQLFDIDEIANSIYDKKYLLFDSIASEISTFLKSKPTKQTIEIKKQFSTVNFNNPLDYAKAFIACYRGKSIDGYPVEFGIVPGIVEIIEKNIVSFYSREDIRKCFSDEVASQLYNLNEIIQTGKRSTKKVITDSIDRKALALLGTQTGSLVMTLASTAIGAQLISSLGHYLATASGKAVLHQAVIISSKVTLSAGFKTFIMAAIQKMGMTALLHSKVGHAITATIMTILGVAVVPEVIILVTLITTVLIIQYQKFPEKLSKKLPPEIVEALNSEFRILNRTIVNEMISISVDRIIEECLEQKRRKRKKIIILSSVLAGILLLILVTVLFL